MTPECETAVTHVRGDVQRPFRNGGIISLNIDPGERETISGNLGWRDGSLPSSKLCELAGTWKTSPL